jgi:hypothetical protein
VRYLYICSFFSAAIKISLCNRGSITYWDSKRTHTCDLNECKHRGDDEQTDKPEIKNKYFMRAHIERERDKQEVVLITRWNNKLRMLQAPAERDAAALHSSLQSTREIMSIPGKGKIILSDNICPSWLLVYYMLATTFYFPEWRFFTMSKNHAGPPYYIT